MKQRFHWRSAVLCTIGLLLFLTAGVFPSFAQAKERHTLRIVCSQEDVILENMEWKLFFVGERKNGGNYALTGRFEGYPVDFDDLKTASALQDAATTLENYVICDNVACDARTVTDAEGVAVFQNVEEGLYLLTGTRNVIGERQYIPSAALVEIGGANSDAEITAMPKIQFQELPSSSSSKFTVNKVWLHDEDAIEDRPATIRLAIYCNGALKQEVTMSEETGWSYSFTGDALAEWRVVELGVPDVYTVVYRNDGQDYLVINSRHTVQASVYTPGRTEISETLPVGETTLVTTAPQTTDSGSGGNGTTDVPSGTETDGSVFTDATTTATDNPSKSTDSGSGTTTKLPQTGQLWWPVPILAAAGLIFMIVGVKLHGKSK